MGCASSLVKYLVFLFNLVFAIAGLAMLIVGILYQLDIKDISDALDDGSYTVGPILLIIIGSIVFVISFFGCCGAIRESTCMLTTYGLILVLLLILQIALGVFIFLQVKDGDDGSFKKEVQKALDKSYNKYFSDTPTMEAIDTMQQLVKCCGNYGYGDFKGKIPSSCCEDNKSPCQTTDTKFHNAPCNVKLYDTLQDSIEILGYVALGLCVTELVASIFSFCLSSSIKNERRRGRHYA